MAIEQDVRGLQMGSGERSGRVKTALYAMTLTVLGSVLLHGGGSVVIARSLTGPPPSAASGPGSPGTDEPESQVIAKRS
ncbi:hypothetical protein [Streptomyces sp. NPDC048481]|uniref:hypothetical protein n=1 Tax=Streptomyces sp. NPDC048481 TaxID=3365557 RepID=UPI0037155534